MTQINQYTNEALTLGNDDFFDIDKDTGGAIYESNKLKFSTLISLLGSDFLASCNTVTVTQESDFPAGNILTPNTTYLICGSVNITIPLSIVVGNCIFGFNPNEDKLIQTTPASVVFRVIDQSFHLYGIGIENPDGDVWSATNYTVSSDVNHGRNKRLSVQDIICTNCDGLGSITGFDLVDFTNCFHSGIITSGITFKAVFHLQLTSCEFYKFKDKAGITFNPLNMVVFDVITAEGIGFGVVNVNNCIIHPEVAQNGLVIHNTTLIALSAITGNSFASLGLTTGTLVSADFDIHNSVIIEANNGYRNYKPIGTMNLIGNVTDTIISVVSTPVQIEGNGAFTFPLMQRTAGTPDGEITYNGAEQTNFTITCQVTCEIVGGTNQLCKFYFASNGVPITSFFGVAELDNNIPQTITFSAIGLAEPLDTYSIYVENTTSTNDILISDLSFSGFGF